MAKKFHIDTKVKRNKKGKIVSETVKAIANQDKLLSFNEVNRVYKEMAKEHSTENILVIVRNGQGRFSSLKAHGDHVEDLFLDDYYQKYDHNNR
jgi:hypothetical protein